MALEGLLHAAVAQVRPSHAAQLGGAVERWRVAIGTPLPPADCPDLERAVAALRTQLGEAAFEEAWAQGRALTLAQAVACALGDDDVG